MTSSKLLIGGLTATALAVLVGGQSFANALAPNVQPEAVQQTSSSETNGIVVKKKKKKRKTTEDHGGSFKM